MATRKFIFFDATFLKFAGDLRGIPQVLFTLVEVCAEPEFRERIRFLCYPEAAEKYLLPLGVPRDHIAFVGELPLLGRFERFHGLGSTRRYAKAMSGLGAALIHPEARSVTRLPLEQAVLWHDLLQIQGRWSSWRKPTRHLLLQYKYFIASRFMGMANSAHTRREVLGRYPRIAPERITVTWLGIRGRPPEGRRSGRPQLPLECIYIGSLEGRKNVYPMLGRLGEIFGALDFTLNLVGRISKRERARAEEILASAGFLERVRFHGLLPDAALRNLMARCDITLFPSLAEGFGLPVVEAMAHGHLVFAFRNTSIIEVAGDGAVLADDSDFKAWGSALEFLLQDPSAASDLRRRALERSGLFSEDAMKARFREYFLRFADEVGA